jgi:hypothetical protein
MRFHCDYCGRDGHKDEFCFKRKREERMVKDWANKDKYHPSSGVLKPRVQLPIAKASVRTITVWGERTAAGSAAGGVKPVRLVLKPGGWSGVFTGGQFARRSPFLAQYGDERSRSFEIERREDPRFTFRGFDPPLGGGGLVFSEWLSGWCSWR